MRAQIFKIAGVKNDKEFYKKFPTEAAFMKKHGKAFKKAQVGTMIKRTAKQPTAKRFDVGKSMSDYKELFNAGYTPPAESTLLNTLGALNDSASLESITGGATGGTPEGIPGGGGSVPSGSTGMGNAPTSNTPVSDVPEYTEMTGDDAIRAHDAAREDALRTTAAANIQKANEGVKKLNADMPNRPRLETGNPDSNVTPRYPVNELDSSGAARIASKLGGSMFQDGGSFDFKKMSNVGGSLIDGIKGIQAEKEEVRRTEQAKQVSEVSLLAQRSNANVPQEANQYVRPEDIQNTGEEFFPIYGVGTNINVAQDGGYLSKGRRIPMAMDGNAWGQVSKSANAVGDQLYGENAGKDLGGDMGEAVGSIWGPGGAVIGEQVGKGIGFALDRNPAKIKKNVTATNQNIGMMTGNDFGTQMHNEFSAFSQDGGMHRSGMMGQPSSMQTYRDFASEGMDTLKDGGDLNGDVQTHWGGRSKAISYNPYLPDNGETIEFQGDMHNGSKIPGKSGIGVSYAGNPVEVEGGEPATKLQNGGGEENLVVYGNLKIPKGMLGDADADGKKFKNYVKDISKKEESANRKIEKNMSAMEGFKPLTSLDKLKQSSIEANLKGANMKLKTYADKKQNAAMLQKSINDTAEEFGIVADDLARGKIKVDKGVFKASNKTAQDGTNLSTHQKGEDVEKLKADGYDWDGTDKDGNAIYTKYVEGEEPSRILIKEGTEGTKGSTVTTKGKSKSWTEAWNTRDKKLYPDSKFTKASYIAEAKRQKKADPEVYKPYEEGKKDRTVVTPEVPQTDDQYIDVPGTEDFSDSVTIYNDPVKERSSNLDFVNDLASLIPKFRPSDAEGLNPNQLYGEMNALSNNRLEPVKSQSYVPRLDVPYDISLQDQRNEVTSGLRGAQRLTGYNPSAQGSYAADAYNAKNKTNAEEFRLNQAKKDQVYSSNRATMNEAQLKNLDIDDIQYQRQTQAKANTKEAFQNALNSISGKYAQNQLEQRTLATHENMYNYRFGKDYKARNFNDNAEFDLRADPAKGEANRKAAEDAAKKASTTVTSGQQEGQVDTNEQEFIPWSPDDIGDRSFKEDSPLKRIGKTPTITKQTPKQTKKEVRQAKQKERQSERKSKGGSKVGRILKDSMPIIGSLKNYH